MKWFDEFGVDFRVVSWSIKVGDGRLETSKDKSRQLSLSVAIKAIDTGSNATL